jgi:hypothetical protein
MKVAVVAYADDITILVTAKEDIEVLNPLPANVENMVSSY